MDAPKLWRVFFFLLFCHVCFSTSFKLIRRKSDVFETVFNVKDVILWWCDFSFSWKMKSLPPQQHWSDLLENNWKLRCSTFNVNIYNSFYIVSLTFRFVVTHFFPPSSWTTSSNLLFISILFFHRTRSD